MTQAAQLIRTIKTQLKIRGLTYQDVAKHIGRSESSVKRLLSIGNLDLARLIQICELLDLTLAELTHLAANDTHALECLSHEQEQALVADKTLLLITICTLNHWTLDDITTHYNISRPECLRYLFKLERMRLIELLPDNRIRIKVARDFEWLRGGPIEHFFITHYRDEFLSSENDEAISHIFFIHGMLSESAQQELRKQLNKLRQDFAQLHQASLSSELEYRHGTSLFLAMRSNWEPEDFKRQRRAEKPSS